MGDKNDEELVENDQSAPLNAKAVQVLIRCEAKLSGTDFDAEHVLPVDEQVLRLIGQATNIENLCTLYVGSVILQVGYQTAKSQNHRYCSFW